MPFYVDLRGLLLGIIDEDSDSDREPSWDMVPLLHVRHVSRLHAFTTDDLKKRAQHHIWKHLRVEISTSHYFVFLFCTNLTTNPALRYRIEKVNFGDSLFRTLTQWEIPPSCPTLRFEACYKEDVCLTLCRWRPPSYKPINCAQFEKINQTSGPVAKYQCACVFLCLCVFVCACVFVLRVFLSVCFSVCVCVICVCVCVFLRLCFSGCVCVCMFLCVFLCACVFCVCVCVLFVSVYVCVCLCACVCSIAGLILLDSTFTGHNTPITSAVHHCLNFT